MYPQQIIDYAEDISNHFTSWAENEDLEPTKFCQILTYEISKRVFPKWIKDSTEFLLDEAEILDALQFAYTEYHLQSLQDKGLIDCIDNEEGETIWFPTEKASQIDLTGEDDTKI